jgi:hypothetical protein
VLQGIHRVGNHRSRQGAVVVLQRQQQGLQGRQEDLVQRACLFLGQQQGWQLQLHRAHLFQVARRVRREVGHQRSRKRREYRARL